MEDLIPLIILIVISVIGMIGKKKQQNAAKQQAPMEMEHENDDLFSWFDELRDNTVEDQAFPQVETVSNFEEAPKETEPEKQDNYQSKTVKDKIRDQYAAFSGTISHDEHQEIKQDKQRGIVEQREYEKEMKKRQKKTAEIIEHKPAFNLKQAVIYSEILNRKYI